MVLMWLAADQGWGVLLNGVVGGAAGAGVTGIAVWRTLRSERKRAAEAIARERERARDEELRGTVLRLHAACARYVANAGRETFNEVSMTLELAAVLSGNTAPPLSDELMAARTISWAIDEDTSEERAPQRRRLCEALGHRLGVWLSYPDWFAETVHESAVVQQRDEMSRRQVDVEDVLRATGEGDTSAE